HGQVIEADRLRLSVIQDPCVPRDSQGTSNLIVGVVITLLDDNANSICVKPCQLITEKHCDLHVRAIVVIKVPRKYNEGNLLFDAEVDHALEGVTGRPAHSLDLHGILQGEGPERAVQMNVSSVNEFHTSPSSCGTPM
ncbi:MAG: hypothetical protein ACREX8_17465, partial [Gammaproteobacteria bacterium]